MRKLKIGILAGLAAALMLTGCGGQKSTKNVAADKLINMDLQEAYPEQPEEIADVYCSISKEIHAESTSDEQAEKLLRQMRKLFDLELLAQNDFDQHLQELNKERQQYKNKKITIVRYTVQDKESIVIEEDQKGRECCTVDISYSIRQGSSVSKDNEQLIMRKDEDGQWKILGNKLGST